MMTIEEMKKQKQHLGYSNGYLSDLSGVPLGTINKIFSGETKHPRRKSLEALDNALTGVKYCFGSDKSPELMLCEPPAEYGTGVAAGANGERPRKPGEYIIADYYALPEDRRAELLDGRFYDMASPNVAHQRIAGAVYNTISNAIRARGGKCSAFIAPLDVLLGKDMKTMLEPDVMVVCDPEKITTRFISGAPDFILEVISHTTAAHDYIRKSNKYLESGVKEYWIIDPERQRLVIYNFAGDAVLKILPLEGKAAITIFPEPLEVDLDELRNYIPT